MTSCFGQHRKWRSGAVLILIAGMMVGLVVLTAVVQRTGRPDLEVSALLTDAPIENDQDLITLANALAALEEEVRHP